MPLTEAQKEAQILKGVQRMFEQQEERREEDVYADMRRMFTREEEDRQQKIKEQRIRQIKENVQVSVPTETIQKESFATGFKENISSTKRNVRSKLKGSRLYQKKLDAQKVEQAKEQWEQTIAKRKKALATDFEGYQNMDILSLSQYLTEDKEYNRTLFLAPAENGQLSDVQSEQIIRQFMELSVNVDLRNDTTVAKESTRLEELVGKTDAIKYLLRKHPEITEHMTEEKKEDLKVKIEMVEQVANYYQIQKKVMTNSYYRTHYNSEISYKYHEEDTLEQKNLTILLWQAECLRAKENVAGDNKHSRWLFNRKRIPNEQEKLFTEQTKELFKKHLSECEYGKTVAEFEDSRHADYFRQHNQEGDPVYERLKGLRYHIVNFDEIVMEDFFCRHMATMPRWKAIQHMSPEALRQMIEALTKTPTDTANPEEMEACKQANIQGLLLFKEQLAKQVQYLKKKYGNGFLLLTPQEIADHNAEFTNDFTNMQTLSYFVEFIRKLPKEFGLYNEDSQEDQELFQLTNYYQIVSYAEGSQRNLYSVEEGSYSTYKEEAAQDSIRSLHFEDLMAKSADTMHLDIRWDTLFDEHQVEFDELTRFIKYKPMKEIIKETNTEHPTWNMLIPETKEMTRKEAAAYFLEKECHITEEMMQQWRTEGLDFGAINYYGVGSDDFSKINQVYRNILQSEELQRAHGLTDPEVMAEFREHIRLNGEMQAFCKREIQYGVAAGTMLDRMDIVRGQTGGDTESLMAQLADDLNELMVEHVTRENNYRLHEGDTIYNAFNEFKAKHDFWLEPSHKEKMAQILKPEMEKQQKDVEVSISGITVQTFKEQERFQMRDMAALLEGKRLKEGVSPEKFQETLEKYNQEFAKERILYKMREAYSGDVDSPEEHDPLWNHVPSRRMFFQFDICIRHRSCDEQKEALYYQLENMVETLSKTAEEQDKE